MDSDSEWSTSGPITDTDTDNEAEFIARHHDYVDLSLCPKFGCEDPELAAIAEIPGYKTMPGRYERQEQPAVGQFQTKSFSLGRVTQVRLKRGVMCMLL